MNPHKKMPPKNLFQSFGYLKSQTIGRKTKRKKHYSHSHTEADTDRFMPYQVHLIFFLKQLRWKNTLTILFFFFNDILTTRNESKKTRSTHFSLLGERKKIYTSCTSIKGYDVQIKPILDCLIYKKNLLLFQDFILIQNKDCLGIDTGCVLLLA